MGVCKWSERSSLYNLCAKSSCGRCMWLEPMAHATDWDRRVMHRAAGVEAICRTREYHAWQLICESGSFCAYLEGADPERLAALQALEPPSPWDKSLTKRAWEKAMQAWRRELRGLTEFRL